MKSIKIEVIDGSIHSGEHIYTKGDIFEIDEKEGKRLIENKIGREVLKAVAVAETEEKTADGSTQVAQGQEQTNPQDTQADVFGKISDELSDQNKNKGKK